MRFHHSPRLTHWLSRTLLTGTLLLPGPVLPAIYRCLGEDGSLLFSQFACPPTTHIELPKETAVTNVVVTPPLTRAELSALAALDRSLEQRARARRQARKKQRQAAARARSESQALCDQARTALADIASIRRKGYSAERDNALDAQQRKWQQAKKANC